MRHDWKRTAIGTVASPSSRRSVSAWLLAVASLTFCVFPPAGAAADDDISTLDRIAASRTINIGYRTDLPPFSYALPDGAVVGYSIDLCKIVVDALKAKLAVPEIKVNYVPTSPSTRFILVKTGKVDLECAATTNTAERRKQVNFSVAHFLTATQFVSRRSEHLDHLADLAGHSVATPTGTVVIEQLNAANRTQGLNIAVVPTRGNDDGFNLLVTGRVPAFAQDSIILAARVADMADPSLFVLSSETLGDPEPYGLVYRRGDTRFGDVIDAILRDTFVSPAMTELYKRWFLSPTPPTQANLNLPMSAVLKAALEHPANPRD